MRDDDDTIAAIATAAGPGGIGIVRVSGPRAEAVLRALLRPCPAALESHRVYHGRVWAPDGDAPLDEVLAFLQRAPHSYTGEDVVELQGHGGSANLARLLQAVVTQGARPAAAGEFTRRAFLNGRLDLSQAEAVADVVAARSERALRQAQAQREGALGRRVEELRQRGLALLAEVEAGLDFPEDELPAAARAELAAGAAALAAAAARLGASYDTGRALRDGLEVVLRGAPNVGKSSLLNALAGEERALVDAAPHTTRDYVEVALAWSGVPVVVIDTAGVGDDGGTLAARGMDLGARRAAHADVTVVLSEAGAPPAAATRRLWEEREGAKVWAWTKADLAPATGDPPGVGDGPGVAATPGAAGATPGAAGATPGAAAATPGAAAAAPAGALAVTTSARTGTGLAALRAAVLAAAGVGAGGADGEEGAVAATARQRDALAAAATAAGAAAASLRGGAPAELAAVDLRAAATALGEVGGAGLSEAVLDVIFARFCVGK